MTYIKLNTMCHWALIATIIKLALLGDHHFVEAVADPEPGPVAGPLANPEPCCRGRGLIAGALGFAGGVLVGRHLGRHHGCGGCGCGGCGGGGGCGGCGGGCGWCGGGHYGRKRRSLDEVLDDDALEDMFWKISQQDQDQCGLRMVCELAQKDPNYLTPKETILLLPYRGREKRDLFTYYGQYDQAAWHGQRGDPCSVIYSMCVFNSTELMLEFANKSTMAKLQLP